ncbi:hypothetical protein TNCV_4491441 [Trichonephila clavipes]|nr:hypothetical protein TNCV_4491441 [Trichonephila clavipes]
MLFEFRKEKYAMEAKRTLCDVFGEEAVRAVTCQRWLAKFHSGDFSLKEESRSAKQSDVIHEVINSIIRANLTLKFHRSRLQAWNSSDYCLALH